MTETKVPFKRDNGQIVMVDASEAWNAEHGMFLTLPDGEVVRRCTRLNTVKKKRSRGRAFEPDVVSDSLGVTKWQVAEMQDDAKRNGYHVEFVEDKGPSGVEGFYPCKGTPAEIARYEKYRMGSSAEKDGGGSPISAADIETARERVLKQYPIKDGK